MKSRDPYIQASSDEFETIYTLGTGAFGIATLKKYKGSDPAVLSLTQKYQDENVIVVKETKPLIISESQFKRDAKTLGIKDSKVDDYIQYRTRKAKAEHATNKSEFQREIKNLNYITDSQLQHAAQGCGIILESGENIIASQLISYDKNNSHAKDLKSFLTDQHYISSSTKDFNSLITTILHDTTSGIHQAQSELHKHGILHLDSAPRNFMLDKPSIENGRIKLSLKVIDFGTSRQLKDLDSIELTGSEKDLRIKLPYAYMNHDAIFKKSLDPDSTTYSKKLSIHSDIFSKKTSIILILGRMASISASERTILNLGDKNHKEHMELKKSLTDTEVLNKYLDNVKNKTLNTLYDNDPRRQIINRFISCFEKYLTSVPDSALSFSEAMHNDEIGFNKALAHFEALTNFSNLQYNPIKLLNNTLPFNDYFKDQKKITDAYQLDTDDYDSFSDAESFSDDEEYSDDENDIYTTEIEHRNSTANIFRHLGTNSNSDEYSYNDNDTYITHPTDKQPEKENPDNKNEEESEKENSPSPRPKR